MKLVFMGTPDFAAESLKSLIAANHEILAVVTQPDKPKGRGKAMACSAVKELAIKENLPVLQPIKIKKDEEFYEELKRLNPDCIVVAAFGQMLPQSILDLPKYGCINVHASLLPGYRGAAPIQWVVVNGEKEAGVTIMHMDIGCDTGDMIIKDQITLDEKETGGSLHDKLAVLGGNLIVKALKMIEDGSAPRIPQDVSQSSYYGMFKKEDGQIDFTKSAIAIERLIRGLNPWPSAYTSMEGKGMKLWEADVMEGPTKGACGEIVDVTKDTIVVQTGEGYLCLKEIQLEGKKRMPVDAFIRGYEVKKGTILGK